MNRSASLSGAAALALVLSIASSAAAVLPSGLLPCRKAIAGSGRKYVDKAMKIVQKCNQRNLAAPGSCVSPQPEATLAVLAQKTRATIDARCGTLPPSLLGVGFLNYPGPCPDADPGDGFTAGDLEECIVGTHQDIVDAFIDAEYATTTPVDSGTFGCQRAISREGRKFVGRALKAVQRCRALIDKGALTIPGETCATADAPTVTTLAKARSAIRTRILGTCDTVEVQALGTCADPVCAAFCGTCHAGCVADCIIATHESGVSSAAPEFVDLTDVEYPAPPVPPNCGDGLLSTNEEECDGLNDAACPGRCGEPSSPFPCLCLDTPRQRVVEHATTDVDSGWRGAGHDSGVIEGAGFVVDLYDCDGPGGPDTLCTLGPSCSVAPHPPCSTDAQCNAYGLGTCRKTLTAVGPRCNLDVQKSCVCSGSASVKSQRACSDTVNCPSTGDFCRQQFHGPPLPLSSSGIPVCVINVFTEDVTGTRDLATGAMAYRLHQNSFAQVSDLVYQPCPVCSGFCQGPSGDRHLCASNADCADTASGVCVTDTVCSSGPNVDQPCRANPPFGGPTTLFGTTSIDCPPLITSAGTVNVLFDPATTGSVSLAPTVRCDDAAFSGTACAGGANSGAVCADGSECPGGTCSYECFCPNGGAQQQRPNGCDAACVGGPNDASPCLDDSECPGGFCHHADCRPDPTAPAAMQPNEGACTVTYDGQCSVSTYRACTGDADCAPPLCPRCHASETCDFVPRNCFINAGITRTGIASPTDPVTAAVFCLAQTNIGAVDAASGLPGPGSMSEPMSVIETGF